MIDSLFDGFKLALLPAFVVALAAGTGCAARHDAPAAAPDAPRQNAPAAEKPLLSCPPSSAEPEPERPAHFREGVSHYDASRYAEALRHFEALDADGSADGMALYRMAYCQGAGGDDAAAMTTYERARDLLRAREAAGSASVEERFYLVNVLLNMDQTEEAKAAAARAVAAVESCSTPVPAGGISSFRVGKLYGDAGNRERQAAWYRRAIAEFKNDPAAPAAYVQRATAAVASWEVGQSGWKDSIPRLQQMRETLPGDPDLLIALIVAQLHAGDIAGAEASLVALPQIAGRRRDELAYLKGLVRTVKRMAASGVALPDREPDGTLYADLSAERLAGTHQDADGSVQTNPGILQDLAVEGNRLIAAPLAEGDGVIERKGPKQNPVLFPSPQTLGRLDAVQARFVSACLEVLRRGMPLQEIGFTSSISPFVVHDWRQIWMQRHRDNPPGAGDAAADSGGDADAKPQDPGR